MPSMPPGGLSPASSPETAELGRQEPPPAILADRINPLTGDFESLFLGRSLADAFAIEALRVQRATGAAVRDLGNRFREITHVEDDAPELIESMAREAFGDAENAGVARLVQVTVETDPGDPAQLSTVIEYRDLLAPPDLAPRRLVFPR
jgi:hypothetical protein